ncbi:hypothetical protein WKW79_29910 [Variovorax robiniae]|uniref:Tripartite tricarboxylate transporter TctB family protein n=1 Tax=Variovorax robiniae TaxID=1836199 RepID=A0ABU8XG11_9BURK
MTSNPSQLQLAGKLIRSGFWLALLGSVMSFGMVLHYIAGARYDNGAAFLKNVGLWFACPWTLSTAVVIGGAVGLVAIGAAYGVVAKAAPTTAPASAFERGAPTLCVISLVAMFLTGYVGYFVVDIFWPSFYYTPIDAGKKLWLFMQLACMVLYFVGVIGAFRGIQRLTYTLA